MRKSFRNVLLLALTALALGGCASSGNMQPDSDTRLQAVPVDAFSSEKAQKLWQVFERYRGTPYEYGGTSGSGFDCSGFILTAYQEGLGKHLPRTTAQMLSHGDVVHPGEIQPGDVVFGSAGLVVVVRIIHGPLITAPWPAMHHRRAENEKAPGGEGSRRAP